MEQITSRDNPLVKLYIKLKSSKSARDAHGAFCIEGVKICLEAFSEGIEVEQIFVTDRILERHPEVRAAVENRAGVYRISESVEQKLCDTKTPQGIFCICRQLDKQIPLAKIDSGRLFVLLCGIQDPGNLGTIIRTADGLGADGLILTADCCDVYNPKVVRSTMGSLARMDMLFVEDALSFLQSLPPRVHTVASVVDRAAIPPQSIKTDGAPCVLLIGNEGNGLPAEVVSLCDTKTMIPMQGGAESFNAAVAAGILMWTLLQ